MSKKVLIILTVVILTGIFIWLRNNSSERKKTNEIRRVQVKEGPIEKAVEATGEVAPLNRVEIQPPIAGRIEKLLVDEGSRVKSGQILAWLSSNDRAAILDAARAKGEDEVRKWEDTYKPTPIVAPLSGVIILRNAVVGQTVDAGSILFAMSDKLIVLTHVDEVDIGRIRMGMSARVTLDAYPDVSVPGKVTHILYEGSNISNVITYGVKIQPDTTPPFFRSQMTANVHLTIESKQNVLLVPLDALQDSNGETTVLLGGEGEKPEQRPVKVGIKSTESAEIVTGLALGDTVFISSRRYSPQKENGTNPLVATPRRRS